MSAKRISKYDNAKFFLIFVVVVGHLIDPAATANSSVARGLFAFIYSFHMPAFLLLMGLFSCGSKHDFRSVVGKALSFVLIGYLIKLLICLWTFFVAGGRPSFSLLSDNGLAWFMFVSAAFYVLAWLLRGIKPLPVLIVSLLIALFVGYDETIGDFLYLSRIVVFFPFFWVGRMLGSDRLLELLSKRWVKVAAVIVVVLFVCVCVLKEPSIYQYRGLFTGRNAYANIAISNCGWINRLIAYVISFGMVLSVIALTPSNNVPGITTAGTRTLQVYVFHYFLIWFVDLFGFTAWLLSLASWSWVLLIPYALVIVGIMSIKQIGYPLRPLLQITEKR